MSLGLSLLNNFRMETKREKRRGEGRVGGRKRNGNGGTASKERKEVETRLLMHEPSAKRPDPASSSYPLPSAIALSSTEQQPYPRIESCLVPPPKPLGSPSSVDIFYSLQYVSSEDDKPTLSQLRLAIVPGSLICLMACPRVDFPCFFYPHLPGSNFVALSFSIPVRGSSCGLHLCGRSNTISITPSRVVAWSRLSTPCRKTVDRHKRQSEREY